MSNSTESAVPSPVLELCAVFESQLREVEFPGASASILAARTQTVRETADALAAAEASLAQAAAAHEEASQAMRTAAELGMGYAKVYARNDPQLLEALNAIAIDGKARRRKLAPKKRERRVRPKPSNVAKLPLQAERA